MNNKQPATRDPVFLPQTPVKRKFGRSRSLKRCKQEPETQQLDEYQPQVYGPPAFYHSLPCLNQSLPSISNQLEPINNSQLDLGQEPISSAFYLSHSFQQPPPLYYHFSQLAEEAATESSLLPQQSVFSYASSFLQQSQQTAETVDTQENETDLSSFFYVC